MPVLEPRLWTVDAVHAIPDDANRYECIDGALFVSPSPSARHQQAVLELAVALRHYVRQQRVGWLWLAPSDLILGPHTLVQPDLRVHRAGPESDDAERRQQSLLVVEVLSPTTARLDRHEKRNLYLGGATATYWIVDLVSEVVEVWTPGVERPLVVSAILSWQPVGAGVPFTLALPAYFAEANAWG